MAPSGEGLRSEALRNALAQAMAGRANRLEDLLARHGGLPGPSPNLDLAAAFGEELASLPGEALRVLERLHAEGEDDAARTFLPIAAAHGWAACIRAGRHAPRAWAALAELAADDRAPVLSGALEALRSLAQRGDGPDALLAHADDWLESADRDIRFGATALAVRALGQPGVLEAAQDPETVLGYLSRVIDALSGAPRAAARNAGFRRALDALPPTVARVVTGFSFGDRGQQWLAAECERARHPEVRKALGDGIDALRRGAHAQRAAVVESLRQSLDSSKKPLRDPSRVRQGTGRGKRSRRAR
jgi:hypothetical protein